MKSTLELSSARYKNIPGHADFLKVDLGSESEAQQWINAVFGRESCNVAIVPDILLQL